MPLRSALSLCLVATVAIEPLAAQTPVRSPIPRGMLKPKGPLPALPTTGPLTLDMALTHKIGQTMIGNEPQNDATFPAEQTIDIANLLVAESSGGVTVPDGGSGFLFSDVTSSQPQGTSVDVRATQTITTTTMIASAYHVTGKHVAGWPDRNGHELDTVCEGKAGQTVALPELNSKLSVDVVIETSGPSIKGTVERPVIGRVAILCQD